MNPVVLQVFNTAELGEMILEHLPLRDRARAAKVSRQFRDLVHLMTKNGTRGALAYKNSLEYLNFDIIVKPSTSPPSKNGDPPIKPAWYLDPQNGDIKMLRQFLIPHPFLRDFVSKVSTTTYCRYFEVKRFAEAVLPPGVRDQVVGYKAANIGTGYQNVGNTHEDEIDDEETKKMGLGEVVHTRIYWWSSCYAVTGNLDDGLFDVHEETGVKMGTLHDMAKVHMAIADWNHESLRDNVWLYFAHVSLIEG